MFLRHIHTFRAFAIACVVAQHCMSTITWDENSLLVYAVGSFVDESSIWFTFIAGFLFQYLSDRYTPARYYKSKLQNVIIPYLVISIPALILSMTVIRQDNVPPEFYDYPVWQQIVLFVLTGKHLEPLWFIPAIALFYLAAPALLWIDRNRWAYLILIPATLASILIGRDGLQEFAGGGLLWAPVSKAFYLFAPYVFGMLCSRYHDRLLKITTDERNVLFAIAAVAYALNIHYLNGHDAEAYLFTFKMATAPLLVYLAYRLSDGVADRLSGLATYSFGIYFLHGYVIGAVHVAAEQTPLGVALEHGGLFYFLVVTAAVIGGCYWILNSTKQALGSSSRLVVGC